jgi:hypothetical protein
MRCIPVDVRRVIWVFVGIIAVSAGSTSAALAVEPEFVVLQLSAKFISSGTQTPVIEIEGGEKISCASSTMSPITLKKEGGASGFTLTLEKCTNKAGEKCKNTANEEINTETLVGELGYLTTENGKGAVNVAFATKPETAAKIGKFKCGAVAEEYEVKGCVIGSLSPGNKAVNENEFFTLIYKQSKAATQEIMAFEFPKGTPINTCKGIEVKEPGVGAVFKKSGLSMEGKITFCPGMEKIKD